MLSILQEASALRPADPVAWLTAAARATARTPHAPPDLLEQAAPDGTHKAWPGVDRFVPDDAGVLHPEVAGWHLDELAEMVCEAAKIDRRSWRGDWRPLMGWLREGFEPHKHILPAIRRCAERPGWQPPSSLSYFDRPVHEWRAA